MNNLNKELKSDFSKIDESVSNVTSLLKLIIFENFGEKVEILYSIVNDNDKFSKILYAFENMSIKLPSVEEFKSLVMLSIIYYYKDVMNYDWNKIQLMFPNEKDISLRYGVKLRNVRKSIKKRMDNIEKSKEYKNEDIFEIK
jgi:tetrahydromethanopterin S-methyltransferase subunit G